MRHTIIGLCRTGPDRGVSQGFFLGPVIGGDAIEISGMGRDLGVILDRHLNMEAHTKAACRASEVQLPNISRICNIIYPGKPVKHLCMHL